MADHATLYWSDIRIRSLVVHGGLFFHLREGGRVGEISIFTPIQKDLDGNNLPCLAGDCYSADRKIW